MKKFLMTVAIICCLLAGMFAEYRYIMLNLCPYVGDDGVVYIEVFDQVDEYYADPVSEMQ